MSHQEKSGPTSTSRRRPRTIAAGSLGLAAVGVGAVLALGGTASAKPTYTIQTEPHHTLLVKIDSGTAYIAADHRLVSRYHEEFTIYMARGAAKRKGAVTCKPTGHPRPTGPAIKVLVGRDGTETVTKGSNSGDAGSYHVANCDLYKVTGSGNSGNSGKG